MKTYRSTYGGVSIFESAIVISVFYMQLLPHGWRTGWFIRAAKKTPPGQYGLQEEDGSFRPQREHPGDKGEGAYSDGAAAGSAVDGLDDGAEQFDVELLVLHVFGRGKKGFVIVVVFLVVLGGL